MRRAPPWSNATSRERDQILQVPDSVVQEGDGQRAWYMKTP